jgi:hypothetical protein
MSKSVLAAHAGSVFIACCLFVSLYLCQLELAHEHAIQVMSRTCMGVFASIGGFTGLWLMAKRQGKNESLLLAISTLIAVFLLIMALEPTLVV